MRLWMWFITLFLIICPATLLAGKAVLLNIDGEIGPATQDYVARGITQAEELNATLIIIQLDTPGGLDSSMRGINASILASSIPVVTYVAPSGSRAASAGTFIMYASNIAAMAPGTNIGAATPVRITPAETTNPKLLDTEEAKTMSDAAAYLRSLAQLHGRNAEWVEQAVHHSSSLTAEEALQLKVINNVADNLPQLLHDIDGKQTQVRNETKIIDTNNLEIVRINPDLRNQFLSFITNPNIAYLIMLAALYGLFFEFSNPGLVLPGIVGVICLLLALYAFQLMPVNYVGLAMIFLGIGFLIFEVYISSFGIIAIGGIAAFVVGSVMLYDSNDPDFRITTTLILGMATFTTAFVMMLVLMIVHAHKKRSVSGAEALIGREATVVMNETGHLRVMLDGDTWNATSHTVLSHGQHVRVTHVEGLTLNVKPEDKE